MAEISAGEKTLVSLRYSTWMAGDPSLSLNILLALLARRLGDVHNLERPVLHVLLDFWIIEPAPDKTLGLVTISSAELSQKQCPHRRQSFAGSWQPGSWRHHR
jgi:hypothetical protein